MIQQTDDWVAILQQDLGVLSEAFSTRAGRTPALIPGERRTVAVLFLDLEGFTSLSEKLDHEVVHSIVSSVMGGLSRLVEFLETYLACAEYLLMVDRKEEAAHFAWKAYSRASAAGNMKTTNRSAAILEELGEDVQ